MTFRFAYCWPMIRAGNFFILFSVLTNTLEYPATIGRKTVKVLNTILKYSFVDLLLACFLLILGNEPQVSKLIEATILLLAFVGYTIFTLYARVRRHDRA